MRAIGTNRSPLRRALRPALLATAVLFALLSTALPGGCLINPIPTPDNEGTGGAGGADASWRSDAGSSAGGDALLPGGGDAAASDAAQTGDGAALEDAAAEDAGDMDADDGAGRDGEERDGEERDGEERDDAEGSDEPDVESADVLLDDALP